MTSTSLNLPPYPRLGEVYRTFARAFDTKNKNRDVDRLAREGEFDWSLLPELGESLIVTPLRKYTDPEFADVIAQFISHIHREYLAIVLTIPLDSLSREEALPLLIENFFAVQGVALIYYLTQAFGGPDLIEFLDPGCHPITLVLKCFGIDINGGGIRAIFPGTTGSDKTEREMIRRWQEDKQIPDLQSIKRLCEVFAEKAPHPQKMGAADLQRWLVVGRALTWLERESLHPFRQRMRQHLLQNFPPVDVGRILTSAVWEAGERFSELKEPWFNLQQKLQPARSKSLGDKDAIKMELDLFTKLSERVDPDGHTGFHLQLLWGRWHVLSGSLLEALPHYKLAAEQALYRAGSQQKDILEEAMVLGALLKDKSFLKQLKHRAIAFKLFTSPLNNAVIEDWEIEHLRQRFHQIFPLHGMFPEASPANRGNAPLPFLIFDEKEMEKIMPDLRNPDRIMKINSSDGQVRRIPQLMLFSTLGKTEFVDSLLKKGASVNQLDDVGGSALLCAIQRVAKDGTHSALDLLLERDHSKSTLDSLTKKKQINPLFCAIEYGYPDVVEKLLAMGADAEIKGNILSETPLYLCMRKVFILRDPDQYRQKLITGLIDKDPISQEVLRRYGAGLTDAYGDISQLSVALEDPRKASILSAVADAITEKVLSRFSDKLLQRIIEALLMAGANPNTPHDKPARGRTPLMLAASNNCVWAFELMLKYQGDINQQDYDGADCFDIAMIFESESVIQILIKLGKTRGGLPR